MRVGDAHTCAAAEHGLKLPYKEAMSRYTVCVQSLGIYTHADAWEMRTNARQLSMGSSYRISKPCYVYIYIYIYTHTIQDSWVWVGNTPTGSLNVNRTFRTVGRDSR
jgi:hypothetical protein